jgi:hypothetical protein
MWTENTYSANPDLFVPCTGCDYEERWFSQTFSMSGWDTSSALITVEGLMDDYGTVELNGKTVYTCPACDANTNFVFTGTAGETLLNSAGQLTFNPGTNNLTLKVTNPCGLGLVQIANMYVTARYVS